jgi:thiol-disulfide isomerase/thioredoxin
MRKVAYLFTMIFVSVLIISCGGIDKSKDESNENVVFGETKVEVYYFHGDRRCPNCNAIENVAKEFVDTDYKNNEDVKFFAINFDKKENKEIAKKYDISVSSLVIASGDSFMDLTIDAFQYAMTDPDYLKSEMKDIVEEYLK